MYVDPVYVGSWVDVITHCVSNIIAVQHYKAICSWKSYKPSRPTIVTNADSIFDGLRVLLLDEQCQFIVKRGTTDTDCESVCQWHVHSSFINRGVHCVTASEEKPRVSWGTMATTGLTWTFDMRRWRSDHRRCMKSSSAAVKVTDPVRGGTFRLKLAALKVVLFRLMLLYRVLVWFRVCEVRSANEARVCEALPIGHCCDDNRTFKFLGPRP